MGARLNFIYGLNFSGRIELMYFVNTSFTSLAVCVRIRMDLKGSQNDTFEVGMIKLYLNVINIENSSNCFDISLEKSWCERSPFQDLLSLANSLIGTR
jgi:hypothetical protein